MTFEIGIRENVSTNLVLLQRVGHHVHVQAGHVGHVDAQLEDFRMPVDHHPVQVDSTDLELILRNSFVLDYLD
jgi:hypothetical protein